MAIYEYAARKDRGVVHVQLKDSSGRIVAAGAGKTVSEAQQDAREHALDEGARRYLQGQKFPELDA